MSNSGSALASVHWHSWRSPEELASDLKAVGQRVTPQRVMILGAFASPQEHLSADRVYERIAALAPAINRSTVYRTLETFRDLGIVTETDLGGGVREFALRGGDPHHHLVCLHCRHQIVLADDAVDALRADIAERTGFAATIEHLALFGVCAECQADLSGGEEDR